MKVNRGSEGCGRGDRTKEKEKEEGEYEEEEEEKTRKSARREKWKKEENMEDYLNVKRQPRCFDVYS